MKNSLEVNRGVIAAFNVFYEARSSAWTHQEVVGTLDAFWYWYFR